MTRVSELEDMRRQMLAGARAIHEKATEEGRELVAAEQFMFDSLMSDARTLAAQLQALKFGRSYGPESMTAYLPMPAPVRRAPSAKKQPSRAAVKPQKAFGVHRTLIAPRRLSPAPPQAFLSRRFDHSPISFEAADMPIWLSPDQVSAAIAWNEGDAATFH